MELSLQVEQKQILSQRMQQSVAILQMNTISLSEYIHEVAETNPLLDLQEDSGVLVAKNEKVLDKLEWLAESDEQNRNFYHAEQEDAQTHADNRGGKRERATLREYLSFQVNICKEEDCTKRILHFLVESVEDSGYLSLGALEVAKERFSLSVDEGEKILKKLQFMDPIGVGCRTFQECIYMQLLAKNASDLSMELVVNHLEDLSRNRIAQVAKKCKVTVEEVVLALEEIRSCNPKPGSGFLSTQKVEYILPDVLVELVNGELVVSLNSGAVPKISVSSGYVKLLRQGVEAETETYIANKLKQAEWVMQCIHRREDTLLAVASQIVTRQKEFFLTCKGELQPLRMMDVAETLEIHESTVSRAVRDKYIQCNKGVFPMSAFFSKALGGEGEEAVSANAIQQKIKEMIGNEDKKKPLSDQKITDALIAEGIQISRRTVAKYREGMGICGTSARKSH
ncbi:RNA polymerase factor sigma-54 [Chakrabartyella piscis]|uniref:RNA polymerase factor sigma-54 n=1 Tax=Chakrabartyella piscis TaxID=2918914 RepID=UPI002958AF11|nr:RNA polymerase factor sigma-54 [Chakrabartyella piscis]